MRQPTLAYLIAWSLAQDKLRQQIRGGAARGLYDHEVADQVIEQTDQMTEELHKYFRLAGSTEGSEK